MTQDTTTIYGFDIEETIKSALTSLGVLCIGFALGAYYLGTQLITSCDPMMTSAAGNSLCGDIVRVTNTTTQLGSIIGVGFFLVGVALATYWGESA